MKTELDQELFDENQFDKHLKRAKKAARQLLRETPDLPFDDLVSHTEIKFAVDNQPYHKDDLALMAMPLLDSRDALEHFLRCDGWTVREAACLTVGMDPSEFQRERKQFNTFWRSECDEVFDEISRAVVMTTLSSIQDSEGVHWLSPSEFVKWADKRQLLEDHPASLLKTILTEKKPQPETTPPDDRAKDQETYKTAIEERNLAWEDRAVELQIENPDWSKTRITQEIRDEHAAATGEELSDRTILNTIRRIATEATRKVLGMESRSLDK